MKKLLFPMCLLALLFVSCKDEPATDPYQAPPSSIIGRWLVTSTTSPIDNSSNERPEYELLENHDLRVYIKDTLYRDSLEWFIRNDSILYMTEKGSNSMPIPMIIKNLTDSTMTWHYRNTNDGYNLLLYLKRR